MTATTGSWSRHDHRAITGALALCPGRAAGATLREVIAQPDLANDLIVIVGDSSRRQDKRTTFRDIQHARSHPASRALDSEYTESALESEVRRAYESAQPAPVSHSARGLLVMRGARPSDLGPPADELVGELLCTFRPHLAPRVERPAVYAVHDQGSREWLEL